MGLMASNDEIAQIAAPFTPPAWRLIPTPVKPSDYTPAETFFDPAVETDMAGLFSRVGGGGGGSGTGWLSGVAGTVGEMYTNPGWTSFRGETTTYGRVWGDSDLNNIQNQWMFQDVAGSGWNQRIDVACGGPLDGWADAASGGWDDVWTTTCTNIRTYWGNLQRVDLSMSHEFNNGYAWAVSSGDQSNFKTAWARWYNIVQTELVAYGKNAKVVLSCNSDTNTGWTVANGMPNLAYIDIIGCDIYDMWLGSTNVDTQAKWDDHYDDWKGDVPRGPGAWVDFAASCNKPISFPEWGVSPQPENGFYVNNPFWVEKMYEMFAYYQPSTMTALESGKIAGDAYFNAWDGKGMIWPTANSAADVRDMYVSLNWGQGGGGGGGGGAGPTVVTATPGDQQVLVEWTTVAGATGYYVERDGYDNVGTGPGWGTTDPYNATSRLFDKLYNGTLYTFTVTPQGVGYPGNTAVSDTATPTA